MKCIIGHEIQTETGFKVFEAGKEYPESEIGDRGQYFKESPAAKAEKMEEVTKDDAVD